MSHPALARTLRLRRETVVEVEQGEPRVLIECVNGPCIADRHEHCVPLDEKRGRLFVCLCDCHEGTERPLGDPSSSESELGTLRAILREERPIESHLLAMLSDRKS